LEQYQKFYASIYLISLLAVFIIYALIYHSVVKRREWRRRQRSSRPTKTAITQQTEAGGVVICKLLKNSEGTLCPADCFSSSTIVLFCLGAPKHCLLLSYRWSMLTVKASMFHLQCIILSETCCDKNAEAAENCHIF
jgi:hypothetical protein